MHVIGAVAGKILQIDCDLGAGDVNAGRGRSVFPVQNCGVRTSDADKSEMVPGGLDICAKFSHSTGELQAKPLIY